MHDEVMARRRAAAQAGFLNDPGAALAALDDADASVRIAGLRSADRLDALDPDRLVTLLADPEPAVRIAALDVAARHDPDIVGLLDDPVPAVVEMAAWACGERDSDPRPPHPDSPNSQPGTTIRSCGRRPLRRSVRSATNSGCPPC